MATARAASARAGRTPAADLSAVAGDLLHLVDVLRLGRLGLAHRLRLPHRSISGPILMFGLCSPLLRAHRAAGQERRTSPRSPTSSPRATARARRSRRLVALIAIVGTIPYIALQLKAVSCSLETILAHIDAAADDRASAARRHRLVRRAVDGDLRRAVRHPPHRRHRAPGRPDAGGRRRIDRQAAGLPGGRLLRHVLHVRRAGGAVQRARCSEHRRPPRSSSRTAGFDTLDGDDAAVASSPSFCCRASSTSRWSRTTTKSEIRRAAWLFPLYLVLINLFVVPIALAGPADLPRRRGRQRHVRAGAAAAERLERADASLAFVGGLSAATAMVIVESVALVDHGVERPRHAAGAAAARAR